MAHSVADTGLTGLRIAYMSCCIHTTFALGLMQASPGCNLPHANHCKAAAVEEAECGQPRLDFSWVLLHLPVCMSRRTFIHCCAIRWLLLPIAQARRQPRCKLLGQQHHWLLSACKYAGMQPGVVGENPPPLPPAVYVNPRGGGGGCDEVTWGRGDVRGGGGVDPFIGSSWFPQGAWRACVTLYWLFVNLC